MALSVEAGAIVVAVKGKERYLYKGAVLPEGVESSDIKRLKSIGLVKEVKVATRPRATAPTTSDSGADESNAEVTAKDEDEGSTNADPESEDVADAKTKSQSRTKK